MADDSTPKNPSERKIVLRANRGVLKKQEPGNRPAGKRACPSCGEIIYGGRAKCIYCGKESDPNARPAPKPIEDEPQVKTGRRVDRRVEQRAEKAEKKEALRKQKQEESEKKAAEKRLKKQKAAGPLATPAKRKKRRTGQPGVIVMKDEFDLDAGLADFEDDYDIPEVTYTPAAISIPWERLITYLFIALLVAVMSKVLDSTDKKDAPQYKQGVTSLCIEHCRHLQWQLVESGDIQPGNNKFRAQCINDCIATKGNMIR